MLTQRYTNPIDVSAADVATITAATATIDFAATPLPPRSNRALIQRARRA